VTQAFSEWRFDGEWRRYQAQCLEAFEADRAAGRHQTLLVAPPGSGKTVVGLEIVRRLGAPAAVLCPSRTIQRQWVEKQALRGIVERAARADLPVAVPDLGPGGAAARGGAARLDERARRGDRSVAGRARG
jgi:hypothetical protein